MLQIPAHMRPCRPIPTILPTTTVHVATILSSSAPSTTAPRPEHCVMSDPRNDARPVVSRKTRMVPGTYLCGSGTFQTYLIEMCFVSVASHRTDPMRHLSTPCSRATFKVCRRREVCGRHHPTNGRRGTAPGPVLDRQRLTPETRPMTAGKWPMLATSRRGGLFVGPAPGLL